MENQDLLNKKIGDKEIPKLQAKDILIQGFRIEDMSTEKKKVETPLLFLICKHPDKQESMELTKIKVSRNEALKVVGLWVQTDLDGNIQKGSPIDDLLKIAGAECIADLESKTLPTIMQSESSQYLCIKGF